MHRFLKGWEPKRLKALRFGLINLAGRATFRSRQLYIRLSGSHPAYQVLLEVRRRLHALCGWTPRIWSWLLGHPEV